jgi:tRNA(fMet)-specific endonuclease VapC
MRYLLDTNICIAAMKNHSAVVSKLRALTPDDCAVSTITLYELATGVAKCSFPAAEQAKVDLFIRNVHLLSFESASALVAARIRSMLESSGWGIGPYDTLLAGQALATGLILVTANTAEFMRVPGLTVENWVTFP